MLYIADNLKAFRKRMDLTQEQVAQALCLSPQSVSKWERGDSYPDITLLPALANLFKTSVDDLIGMAQISSAKARDDLFESAHAHLRSDAYGQAAAVLEKALQTFPNDEGLMSELALALALEDNPPSLARAAALCERALSQHPSEKVRHTTRAALCFIYFKLGDKDKAMAAAQNLPHMRESREVILAQLEKDMSKAQIDAALKHIALGENA